MRVKVQGRLMKVRFIEIHQVFAEKMWSATFLTVVHWSMYEILASIATRYKACYEFKLRDCLVRSPERRKFKNSVCER